MALAIMSPMAEEIELYLKTCDRAGSTRHAGLTFHRAEQYGHDLILVTSGVGKVNAALCAQILVDTFDAQTLLCTGSAGALNPSLDIGDIVVARDCVQHDVQVDFLGLPRGQIPFTGLRFFESSSRLVQKVQALSFPELQLHVGRVLTGDVFVQDEAFRQELRRELEGECVEMEGAAVGQVAALNDVPFLVVRAISDRADGSSDIDFQAFLQEAAHSSARVVLHLLEALPSERE